MFDADEILPILSSVKQDKQNPQNLSVDLCHIKSLWKNINISNLWSKFE